MAKAFVQFMPHGDFCEWCFDAQSIAVNIDFTSAFINQKSRVRVNTINLALLSMVV